MSGRSDKWSELEKLAKAATPRPWRVYTISTLEFLLAQDNGDHIEFDETPTFGDLDKREDAHFIAAACNGVLALIAELRAQGAALERLTAQLNDANVAVEYVEGQLEVLRGQLNDAEQALEDMRAQLQRIANSDGFMTGKDIETLCAAIEDTDAALARLRKGRPLSQVPNGE